MQVSDTSTNGEQEEGQQDMDIDAWLSASRLEKDFGSYFKENDITFEDILTWDESLMDSICIECNITAAVKKARFKYKVREYQFKSNKTNAQTTGFGKTYRIVMTEKESKAMDVLKAKLNEIKESIQNNKNKSGKLSKDTKDIEDDIKSVFSEIRKKVDEREKALMTQLDNISSEQSKALKDQMECLKQYKDSIKAAMSEQDALSLDPNMDSAKRQSKILKITDDTLASIDDKQQELLLNEMKFIIDDKALCEYIAIFGTVTSQSDPPTVKISEITNYAARITLNLPTECKADDDSIDYQFRYKVSSDDEKTGDWNEIDIDENKNEYLLQNLQSNMKYEACGRYGSATDNLWSRYSKSVQFQTLDRDGWDTGCMGKSLCVQGEVVSIEKEGWGSIWVKGVVSKGSREWRFKIKKHPGKATDFWFGITNENDKKNKDSYPNRLLFKSYQNESYGTVVDAGRNSTRHDGQSSKVGDIIAVKWQFMKSVPNFY